MRRILAGIETEYGLLVEGHGAEDQVEDSKALVRNYPGECFVGWDYRYESPRTDLRGFRLDRLAVDPEDAKFDSGKSYGDIHDIRADRILPNGARFYNDHGHPEYSTPECLSIFELAKHDCAGQLAVRRAAVSLQEQEGTDVRIYKNNTDFHGASYGTHEGYLVPRSLGFERLFKDLMPMMVVRQVLVGAGHLGDSKSKDGGYQLSQRADFLTEAANAETLFRRPIFNTRDEPHSDPSQWIRLHVICGDANMIPDATARKVGLIKMAIALSESGHAPIWNLKDPVRAFHAVSHDSGMDFRMDLDGRNWTTAYEVLESYFAAAEHCLELDEELSWVINSSRQLLDDLRNNFPRFKRQVDWAAKKSMLQDFVDSEGTDWNDPLLRSFDLEYHNVDPNDGLHSALVAMDEVAPDPDPAELWDYLEGVSESTRAFARGLAVTKYKAQLKTACWRSLSFEINGEIVEVEMPPDAVYPPQLAETNDVETFISMMRGIR